MPFQNWVHSTSTLGHFYAFRSYDRGHIDFVFVCLSVCLPACILPTLFYIRYKCWTVKDRNFWLRMQVTNNIYTYTYKNNLFVELLNKEMSYVCHLPEIVLQDKTCLRIFKNKNNLTQILGGGGYILNRQTDFGTYSENCRQILHRHIYHRNAHQVGSIRVEEVLYGRMVLVGLHYCHGKKFQSFW